jgi:hypothetical protein
VLKQGVPAREVDMLWIRHARIDPEAGGAEEVITEGIVTTLRKLLGEYGVSWFCYVI